MERGFFFFSKSGDTHEQLHTHTHTLEEIRRAEVALENQEYIPGLSLLLAAVEGLLCISSVAETIFQNS